MNKIESEIYDEILKDHERVVSIRRYLHQNPELGREEFNTDKLIESELDKLGLSHRRIGETGVYSEIKGIGKGNKTILLRCDIDALPIKETHESEYKSKIPGKMHACGHDSHTASLLGAAKILIQNKEKFGGTVRLCFQQAEEIGYGGHVFVKSGVVDGADRTFGIHAASNVQAGKIAITPGPNNASVDWFKITVKGHPAHVSTPQLGVDAVYIASQIVVAIQALITRRTSPMDNVLIGIGKITAGDAYNIVAQKAELEGTVRVFSPEIRKSIKAQMEKLSSAIAESFGGTVEFEWKDFTSPLINDLKSTEEAQETAAKIFGKENVITNRAPSLGGDDFAEFNLRVPGVYCYVGTGNNSRPETRVAHHDSNFDIDEDALRVGVAIYVFYTLDFLNGNFETSSK